LLFYLIPIVLAVAGLLVIFSVLSKYIIWVYIGVLVVGSFIALIIFLNWYFTIYRLTSKRVETKSGFLGSYEEQISLEDIQHVDLQRTFAGIIFNYGTVKVKAAGAGADVFFINVSNAKKIADEIEDMSIGKDK